MSQIAKATGPKKPAKPSTTGSVRRLDVGIIVTIALALVAAIFYLGQLEGRVSAIQGGTAIDARVKAGLQRIDAAADAAFPNSGRTYVLVSASALWVDTGIDLSPGQTVQLHASGLVNLAIHRVVLNADKDLPPSLPWTGPGGIEDLPKDKPLYFRRRPMLVLPEAKYGALLLYVQQAGDTPPSKHNPCPSPIQVVGGLLSYTYPADAHGNGRVFLTVNDTVLKNDAICRDSYVGTQDGLDVTYGKGRYTVAGRSADWKRLVEEQYWDKWFDDNAGAFLVEIDK